MPSELRGRSARAHGISALTTAAEHRYSLDAVARAWNLEPPTTKGEPSRARGDDVTGADTLTLQETDLDRGGTWVKGKGRREKTLVPLPAPVVAAVRRYLLFRGPTAGPLFQSRGLRGKARDGGRETRSVDAAKDLQTDYEINGKRSAKNLKSTIIDGALEPWFRGRRMASLTTADIRAYVADRQEKGYANATNNRELAALKRMFTLGRAGGEADRPAAYPDVDRAEHP